MRTKFLFLLLLSCLFSTAVIAQTPVAFDVSGKVINGKSRKPMTYAIVKLLQKADSAEVASVLVNDAGVFRLSSKRPGQFIVKFTFIGFNTIFRDVSLTLMERDIDLGTIVLTEGIELSGVTVTHNVVPVLIKKDTLEYNANAFKTAPNANVEQMLRKIAGFEIDDKGNIRFGGEVLSRVTVENKKFFGGNYKIATQNLPADAIEKIQVIESKTEQAKETGIDDGKREKVINLVLKEDKKGGWFGSGSAAGGSRERYLGSGNLNHFTSKIQLNMLAMRNNTNQSYSVGEVGGYGGYDPGPGAVSGMINGVAYGRTGDGLATTNSGAINFSTAWGPQDRTTFNTSYIGSKIASETQVQSNIQNIQLSGNFFSNNLNRNTSDNQSHEYGFYLVHKIDTLTTFTIAPSLSYQRSEGASIRTLSTVNSALKPLNNSDQRTGSYNSAPLLNAYITIRRQMPQQKGNISLNLSSNFSSGTGTNNNINSSVFYDENGIPTNKAINQWQDLDNRSNELSARLSLNRAISKDKKTFAILNSGISRNKRHADQATYDYNPITGFYELIVPSLTSRYENNNIQQDVEAGFNTSNTKLTVTAYAKFQHNTLKGGIDDLAANEISRDYWAVLPRLTLSYRSPGRRSVNLNISTQQTLPSVTSLQPVQNNINPLYIRDGNPDLQPATSYSANLSYNSSDPKKGTYNNYSAAFAVTENAISSSNFFEESSGITYAKPINVNGNYTFSLNSTFGGKFKIKGLGYSLGLSGGTKRSISYVNYLRNTTRNIVAGINTTLNYNYNDLIYLSLYNYLGYTNSSNAVKLTTNTNYFSISNTANANIQIVKKWRFTTDLKGQAYAGRGEGFNQQVWILNSGIQRFLLPKDQLVLELKAYDLLNQNAALTRTITENRIEDTRTMNLQRYALLKLTYRVNKVGKKN